MNINFFKLKIYLYELVIDNFLYESECDEVIKSCADGFGKSNDNTSDKIRDSQTIIILNKNGNLLKSN